MKKLGIYVHIPFCKRKCNYCDFYSVKWNEEIENGYIQALIQEIKSYSNMKYDVDTVFFGGGTPTVIKPQNLGRIINEIKSIFNVNDDAEISLEANPNTLTSENLAIYKEIGINRLSIGVQSLNDEILRSIGRLHNSNEAIESIERAKLYGYENLNVDLMFNIPGQRVTDIEETILKIIQQDVKHISFYSLKLEKGTPLYDMERDNKIVMPDEAVEREMYYKGRELMQENGIMQYEISNFSKPGFECKHNLRYWNQEEYIGLGPSSHSFLNKKRYSNPSDINFYFRDAQQNIFNRTTQEVLDCVAVEFEYIMLKLRLTDGLDIKKFNEKFNIDFNSKYLTQIKYLVENKLIIYNEEIIKLTKFGMDVSNFVFEKFII
jgi:oxygen-independent coproporphyrinogen-3 oxidase